MQSLSGDAERDVAVEAVGQDECSLYSEDTVTDEDGRFRLRGLLVSVCSLRINADLWKRCGSIVGFNRLRNTFLLPFSQNPLALL